ncbi:CRISPR-associated endonuclease/helicase Cas3 [Actinoalloteichus hoggarensis]|uniref:DEAD/DEAH box helicase n=1 Tax=Actinoalloteichus hoggarensis TaxID=1470176 RepID=A0A221W342_9PSEU|nr:CRISPR-associated endonuclease Cas3'' [Actinoalloteichus hoggarensis]ASO20242.1 DEAD/DEAH box helicase [Actinoalloteichus hoggarensis]MBB5919044.1 CRISPR-associated endonuclease/helicase Cas3 [Actinoalloteichus hoggarensis]
MDAQRTMYAHSRPLTPVEHWHRCGDHAEGTARLARSFAEPLNAADLGEVLGLCHDAGKCLYSWQRRLLVVGRQNGRRGHIGIPHADVGAHLLRRVAGPAALTVLGHHKGLTTVGELADLPTDPESAARFAEAGRAFLREVPRAEAMLTGPTLLPAAWEADRSVCDIGLRLLYSALVDADYLDTGAFMAATEVRLGEPLDPVSLLERFDRVRSESASPVSALNLLRGEIHDQAVQAAVRPRGIYRLATGTGTGKTLASTGFALHHAREHRLRRVIMAVPFITITRQNAEVLRHHLGADTVLEDHSAVDLSESRMKLAAENWDAPFIVTTTVQLFQSLFSRRPGPMRKLHRIAGSVIVLDEVQALPAEMLVPILDALRVLVEHFGCTVLLCSATQPTFDSLPVWENLCVEGEKRGVEDIVTVPKERLDRARSVRYRFWTDPKPTWDEVARDAATRRQALLIVNTRDDARALHDACLRAAEGHRVLHISRNMCDLHVMAMLDLAGKILGDDEKLLVVTTQLIEAGVDVDFPAVYRARATAEAHLQSAGRCDREGRRGDGVVIIFDPVGGGLPGGYYRTAAEVAKSRFGPGRAAPDDLDAVRTYFEDVYARLGLNSDGHPRNKLNWQDWHHITENRRRGSFRDVADGPHRFRMIDKDGMAVVISAYRGEDGTADCSEQLAALRDPATRPSQQREALRTLQPYVVSFNDQTMERPEVRRRLVPVIEDVLYEWTGGYDLQTGVDVAPADSPAEGRAVVRT